MDCILAVLSSTLLFLAAFTLKFEAAGEVTGDKAAETQRMLSVKNRFLTERFFVFLSLVGLVPLEL